MKKRPLLISMCKPSRVRNSLTFGQCHPRFAPTSFCKLLALLLTIVAALCCRSSSVAVTIERLSPNNINFLSNNQRQQHHPYNMLQQQIELLDGANQINNNDHQSAPNIKTPIPVIGILTEVLRDYKRFVHDRHLFIASSYVKWIESAGAQVVPILLNQNDQYYERMFNRTNGLLFPGGDNLLDPSKRTPMMVAAKKLYRLALEANDRGDFYPIWGTCLGLELLSVLTANRNLLVDCEANDISLPMEFTRDRGKLFSQNIHYANLPELTTDFSQIIRDTLKQENLTYNFHHKCLTDAALQEPDLAGFYKPLAYSRDKNNLKFIAILEANNYPFYAVQFHPEKPPFEFVVKKSQLNVPHSRESIAVSRFFADFFVQQAQLSGHSSDKNALEGELIYAFSPMYTAPKRDMYEQRYLFPYETSQSFVLGLSDEEFIDHVPESDEEVHEEVSEAGKLGNLPVSSNDLDDNRQELWAQGNSMLTINQVVAINLDDADDEDEDDEYEDDDTVGQIYVVN